MQWITIIWSMLALTWLKGRDAWGSLLFSVNAVSAAVTAGFEWSLTHAQNLVCGSAVLFVVLSAVQSSSVIRGVIQMPFLVSIAYLCIIAAMNAGP